MKEKEAEGGFQPRSPAPYRDAFESLYREVIEARRSRKPLCPHGIVQYDAKDDPLPCAFPDCPAGWRGRYLPRDYFEQPSMWNFAGGDAPIVVDVKRLIFTRQEIRELPGHAPRTFLWVDTAALREQKEKHLAEVAANIALAQAEAARVLAATPRWRRAWKRIRRFVARKLNNLAWRISV